MSKIVSLGRLARSWWLMAAVLAMAWFLIWLVVEPQTAVAKSVANNKAKTQNDLLLPKRIDVLVDLNSEVLPLSTESVKQDLRNYADEFKDKAFFTKNKDKWTVQVMDSTTHENIVNYLDIRKDKYQDRDKFYYFRYVDGASKEHYVLIYDLFSNRIMANGVWQERDKRFGLPKDAQIVVRPIKEYLSLIDSYVREETDEEIKIPKEPAVNLKESSQEVPPKPIETDEVAVKTNQPNRHQDVEMTEPEVEAPVSKKTGDYKGQDKVQKGKIDIKKESYVVNELQTPDLAKPPTAKPRDLSNIEPVIETVEFDPEIAVGLESEVGEGGGQ